MKLTNIHHSTLQLLKHLKSEVNHYSHLINKYPDDPRLDNNLNALAFYECIYNYVAGNDDTATTADCYDFMQKIVEDLNTVGLWKKEKKTVRVEQTEEKPFIAQTVQVETVEAVEEKPTVKKSKKTKV